MEINVNGVQITLTEEQLNEIKKQIEKVSAEKRFLELWNGCTIKFDFEKYPNSIFLMKNDKVMFGQDFTSNYLWCNHELVWSIFEKEYGLNYGDTQSLIKNLMERHFKLGSLTVRSYVDFELRRWKDYLK